MVFFSTLRFLFVWCIPHEILLGLCSPLTDVSQRMYAVSSWNGRFASWIFFTEWEKEKMNESLRGLGNYAFLLLLIILHPVVITFLCICLNRKCAAIAVPTISEKIDDDPGIVSATEPPSGDESGVCMAYQVQLLRDEYRLLSNERCNDVSDAKMNIGDFDSVAQLIGGVEVSVSLPTVFMCPRHQGVYTKHALSHT